jgi:predicted metal-dependent enzyme (double-stranded beta helix superfamily)
VKKAGVQVALASFTVKEAAVGKQTSIDDLITGLNRFSSEKFSQDGVLAYLTKNRVDETTLEPYIKFNERTYTRNLIYKGDRFEAVLLCWEPGQHSPVHRHANQLGWMTVIKGQLNLITFMKLRSSIEESTVPDVNWSPVGSIYLKAKHRLTLSAGDVIVEVTKPETIHKAENPASFGQQAISLHIYSEPSDISVIYDVENHRCRTVRMGYV